MAEWCSLDTVISEGKSNERHAEWRVGERDTEREREREREREGEREN